MISLKIYNSEPILFLNHEKKFKVLKWLSFVSLNSIQNDVSFLIMKTTFWPHNISWTVSFDDQKNKFFKAIKKTIIQYQAWEKTVEGETALLEEGSHPRQEDLP